MSCVKGRVMAESFEMALVDRANLPDNCRQPGGPVRHSHSTVADGSRDLESHGNRYDAVFMHRPAQFTARCRSGELYLLCCSVEFGEVIFTASVCHHFCGAVDRVLRVHPVCCPVSQGVRKQQMYSVV